MLDNHLYNLLAQMVEENKSLWRLKNKYIPDAGDCQECQSFYQNLTSQKEAVVQQLSSLIKSHLDQS